MATKENVEIKVKKLLEEIRPLQEQWLKNVLETIDCENEPDDWQFPKEIMVALLQRSVKQYSPLYKPRNYNKKIELIISKTYNEWLK
jgi:hypothetical protein